MGVLYFTYYLIWNEKPTLIIPRFFLLFPFFQNWICIKAVWIFNADKMKL